MRAVARSNPNPGVVLVVERDPQQVRLLREILEGEGHRVQAVDGSQSLAGWLSRAAVDLVVVDLQGGGEFSGARILENVKLQQPSIEVVMLTDRSGVRAAVSCMDYGAFDYLEKPLLDAHRVRAAVRKAIERKRLIHRSRDLERRLEARTDIAPLRSDEAAQPAREPGIGCDAAPLPLSLAAYERAALLRALAESRGDASRAAKLLGIGRSTLYRKLARHRVGPDGEPSTEQEPAQGPSLPRSRNSSP